MEQPAAGSSQSACVRLEIGMGEGCCGGAFPYAGPCICFALLAIRCFRHRGLPVRNFPPMSCCFSPLHFGSSILSVAAELSSVVAAQQQVSSIILEAFIQKYQSKVAAKRSQERGRRSGVTRNLILQSHAVICRVIPGIERSKSFCSLD